LIGSDREGLGLGIGLGLGSDRRSEPDRRFEPNTVSVSSYELRCLIQNECMNE